MSGLPPERLERLLTIFSAERANLLVVTDPGEGPDARRVDISHEALIRNWRRMTTADGQGGWLARELDDGLVWRTLAVSARTADALLDGATLLERETWFLPFASHPARARRYLLRPEGKASMTEEPEWRSVVALLKRSRARYEAEQAREASITRGRRILFGVAIVISLIVALNVAVAMLDKQKQTADEGAKVNATNAFIEGGLDADVQANPQETGRKDTLSDAALKSLTPVLDTVAASSTGDGFIWIGSLKASYLKVPGPGGARMRPEDVKPGARYETRYNIVLRKGPPRPGNVAEAAIDVVPSGALVTAVSSPRPAQAPTGVQYWLEIRDIQPPTTPSPAAGSKSGARPKPVALRVFPHFGSEDLEMADKLTAGLAKRGYNVMGIQVLPQARGFREIRYCDASDEDAANKLVDDFYDILPTRLIIRAKKLETGCGKTARGTLELWLGNP